jgi:hypothetical protein
MQNANWEKSGLRARSNKVLPGSNAQPGNDSEERCQEQLDGNAVEWMEKVGGDQYNKRCSPGRPKIGKTED